MSVTPKHKVLPDWHYEHQANAPVCGVDEAGRGPLAGPVIAAAVILDPAHIPEGLADSKSISQSRREYLLNDILLTSHVGIGISEPEEIDRLNILWASLTAMERAVRALPILPQTALIDGNKIPDHLPCPGRAIIKGDAKSLSIAAASIVAKVTRDRIMTQADKRFPGYGFSGHKGYPTRAHKDAITHLGPCPLHRRSFAPMKYELF